MQPTVVTEKDNPVGPVRDGDAVVFFNFRADRARQLTRALTEEAFSDFPRPKPPRLHFVCLTEYKKEFALPAAFPPQNLSGILANAWADAGIENLRLAETEKYAHVTYFFNGGVENAYPGEERTLVPSWKGATYDLHPQMSAAEITEEAVRALAARRFGAYVVNFANADMVGHTGKLPETIVAIETLDRCFGILEAACRDAGATLVMTADHGNAEQMIDPVTGEPHTAHTLNPVPLVVCGEVGALASGGTLADVAPTILGMQGLAAPPLDEGAEPALLEVGRSGLRGFPLARRREETFDLGAQRRRRSSGRRGSRTCGSPRSRPPGSAAGGRDRSGPGAPRLRAPGSHRASRGPRAARRCRERARISSRNAASASRSRPSRARQSPRRNWRFWSVTASSPAVGTRGEVELGERPGVVAAVVEHSPEDQARHALGRITRERRTRLLLGGRQVSLGDRDACQVFVRARGTAVAEELRVHARLREVAGLHEVVGECHQDLGVARARAGRPSGAPRAPPRRGRAS